MNRPKNFRAYFLLAALSLAGLIVLLREHRPSFLRPDLHLCAYVTTAHGNVTGVVLVKLKATARIPIGAGLSGSPHPPHPPATLSLTTPAAYSRFPPPPHHPAAT